MRVSLTMPCLDMARHVEAAVRSVLAQSHEDLELIVQDGGSHDGSLELLSTIDDPRLSVVQEPDDGQADAVNRGLGRATGEVLGWLNADDELEPGALAAVVAAFEEDPAAELVYGRGAYVAESGVRRSAYDVRPFDRRLLLTRDYILQPAAFWRRSLWAHVGPLDTSLEWAFDWDWFIRASSTTSFRLLDAELARYRLTGENKSLVGGERRQAELALVARRHGGRLQPTYLHWQAMRLARRFPPARLLDALVWRAFPGRITS